MNRLLKQKADARIKSHPNDEYSYYYLGKMYFRLKKWERAKSYYEQSLDIDPNWSSVKTDLSFICEQVDCS